MEQKLHDNNSLHNNAITFTREREKDSLLAMLDMSILNDNGNFSSTWYSKRSATGLIINYHALPSITRVHCKVCYVGKTRQYLQDRFKEQLRNDSVKAQQELCVDNFTEDSVEILGCTSKGEFLLLTLKALWIRETKPFLNTQDTLRKRDMKWTIKL